MLGNYPEESIEHTEHSESLKLKKTKLIALNNWTWSHFKCVGKGCGESPQINAKKKKWSSSRNVTSPLHTFNSIRYHTNSHMCAKTSHRQLLQTWRVMRLENTAAVRANFLFIPKFYPVIRLFSSKRNSKLL